MTQIYEEDEKGNFVLTDDEKEIASVTDPIIERILAEDKATQKIKATIRSNEPITLENLDKFTDSITYEKTNEMKFNEIYLTEILITVDLEAAKKDCEDYESTSPEPFTWTGNIWDWLEDGPISRMNEDNVIPASVDWGDDVEIDYL